jgi:hypothetical protein
MIIRKYIELEYNSFGYGPQISVGINSKTSLDLGGSLFFRSVAILMAAGHR